MKRMTVSFLLVLVSFTLNGCNNEQLDDINKTSGIINEASDVQIMTSEEIINSIELSDFIVTDGENFIELDYPYDEFEIDLPEINLDNNYVGEIYAGDFVYKTYIHKYDDFTLYTSNSNYNFKNRNFDDYYITQITINTPKLKTMRGISIGSSIKEIKNLYGDFIEVIK